MVPRQGLNRFELEEDCVTYSEVDVQTLPIVAMTYYQWQFAVHRTNSRRVEPGCHIGSVHRLIAQTTELVVRREGVPHHFVVQFLELGLSDWPELDWTLEWHGPTN